MRPQLGVVALPSLGDFEILAKAADLIALQPHVEAVVGFANGKVAQLPAKGVVDAVGSLLGLHLYEFERGEVAAKLAGEKGLGQAAGFGFFEARAGCFFLDEMAKTDELARSRNRGLKLLFFQLPHPAVAPAPQLHGIADNLRGPFKTQLAFEKGLGIVVVAENGAVAIVGEVESAGSDKIGRLLLGLVAGDAEVDGGFGKGPVEVVNSNGQTNGGNEHAAADEGEVFSR